MSDVENRPPTSVLSSKSGLKDGITKPKDKTVKPKVRYQTLVTRKQCLLRPEECLSSMCNVYVQEKLSGSERKKLQTLQPSSKNQALLVRPALSLNDTHDMN